MRKESPETSFQQAAATAETRQNGTAVGSPVIIGVVGVAALAVVVVGWSGLVGPVVGVVVGRGVVAVGVAAVGVVAVCVVSVGVGPIPSVVLSHSLFT